MGILKVALEKKKKKKKTVAADKIHCTGKLLQWLAVLII